MTAPNRYLRLQTICNDLLTAAADALTKNLSDASDPRTEPPERQYISLGPPPWDCDQLTVHVSGLRSSQRQQPSDLGGTNCAIIPLATCVITLLRCIPHTSLNEPIPTTTALVDAGEALTVDGFSIHRHLTQLWAAGDLFPDFPELDCDAVLWRPGLQPLAPQGGYGGWTFTAEIQI